MAYYLTDCGISHNGENIMKRDRIGPSHPRGMTSGLLSLFVSALVLMCRAEDLGPMLSDYVPGPDIDDAWSVFVGGNFTRLQDTVGIEGRTFVRGDFTLGVDGQYAIGDLGTGSGGLTGVNPTPETAAMVIGGDLTTAPGVTSTRFTSYGDKYVGSQVPLSLSSVLSISFSLTVDCGQTRLRAGKRQKARLCGSGARLFQDWAAGAELSGG
jgi:hypothetical protein